MQADFDGLAAYGRLRELARCPVDLTDEATWSGDRFDRYTLSACGLDLCYATQRLDDRVLDALQELADEAGLVDQFLAMKRGEIVNRIQGYESEERAALHASNRDVFRERPDHPEAAARAREQLERLRRFLDDLDRGRIRAPSGNPFTTMVQVGIGGSDLGPRALALALEAWARADRRVRFIANVDPDDAAAVLADLDLEHTLVNVVSKSGTTLETLTNETLVRQVLENRGLDPSRHLVAVTGAGSPMDDPSRYLGTFHMYDYIGGRYSVTSMVGLVSLGFLLGYEQAVDILAGAHAMDRAAEERELRRNMPLLMAMIGIWNRNFLALPTVAILPYAQALARFPAHLQQCDMESNGKSVTRRGEAVRWSTGPIVWGEPGTNGQHAFYQLLHQGTEVVPAEFIGFRKSQRDLDPLVEGTSSQQKLLANMVAQALALARGKRDRNPNRSFPGNRPSLLLLADRLTPEIMGALLSLYENRIVYQGFCWNINSFDQEGVQLGKVLASEILDDLAGRQELAPQRVEAALLAWCRLPRG